MKRLASLFTFLALCAGTGIVSAPFAGASQIQVLYAYPTGGGTTCTTAADHCSLDTAFGLISNYDTVTIHLVEPGTSGYYASASGYQLDSPGVHLSLVSDTTGVNSATFDGGSMTTPILTISNNDVVTVSHVIFQNANITGNGGAIAMGVESDGGSLTVIDSVFHNNTASGNGGAIDVADYLGSGSLKVVNSSFVHNTAGVNGGAIDIGDFGGRGNLDISGTAFRSNATLNGNGGAIDMADGEVYDYTGAYNFIPLQGAATATITSSVFTTNTANDCGGAISSANGGYGNLTLTNSKVVNNASQRGVGGAIDAGDGSGSVSTLNIDATSFSGNNGGDYGGAISNGEDYATSALANISRSSFINNAATGLGLRGGHEGGAISNGTYGGNGVLNISYSTFAGNGQVSGTSANDLGGTIFNGSLGTTAMWRSTVTTTDGVANVLYTRGSFYLAGDILPLTNSDSCHVHDGTFSGSAQFISGGYNISASSASGCVNPSVRDKYTSTFGLHAIALNSANTSSYNLTSSSPALQFIPAGATFNNNGVTVSLCGAMDQALGQIPAGDRCNAGSIDSAVASNFSAGTGSTISQFPLNSAKLSEALKTQISKVATAIVALRIHTYICVGYTDSIGSTSRNVALSDERANAVRNYLVQVLSAHGHANVKVLAYGAGVNSAAPSSPSSREVVIRLVS